MTIDYSAETFAGRFIEEYDPKKGIQNPSKAVRLSIDWDASEQGETLVNRFDKLLVDPQVSQIDALIIGPWEDCYEAGIQRFIEALVEHAGKLPKLSALFVGEMTIEDCEISWIIQGDYTAFWGAFPNLKVFQVRGGSELTLGPIQQESLEELIIETGGLPANVLSDVITARMPNLNKLELWLGTDDYGWSGNALSVLPLLESINLPKLKALGLRDSEDADEVAALIADSPILEQLEQLDLSLGNIGDKGAKALLDAPLVKQLKRLDLTHHYISNAVAEQLMALDVEVVLEDPQEEEEGERYIAVSE